MAERGNVAVCNGKNTDTRSYLILTVVKSIVVQQCKRNPLLLFNGNTEHSCVVDNYIYSNNEKRGTYCCVSMAAAVTRTRHSVTLYVNSLVSVFNFRESCIGLHIDMLLFPALCAI
jgi:hypothetical protein